MTVANVNHGPIADAGDDASVDDLAPIALDGTGSVDPDGDALAFTWVQLAGPAVVLSGADTATPGFVPADEPCFGASVYRFQVTVADGYGGTATDEVEVTVADAPHDGDGDGVADCSDGCPADPGKVAAGICGCGVADSDSDGDGAADCVESCDDDPAKTLPGICGCGVADTDGDGDGTADCDESCDDDPLKIAPGICGCGVADTDGDGDGTAACDESCDDDPLKLEPGVCGCGEPDVDVDEDGRGSRPRARSCRPRRGSTRRRS